jgi:hypothetical protein
MGRVLQPRVRAGIGTGHVAAAVTETVERAGASLQETSLDQLTGDVVALVRRYPVASVLIGLGVGFLLARSLGSARPT